MWPLDLEIKHVAPVKLIQQYFKVTTTCSPDVSGILFLNAFSYCL